MEKVFGVIYVLMIAACVYCVAANQIQHATLFAALAMLNQRAAFNG